jgi:hypothetical protein
VIREGGGGALDGGSRGEALEGTVEDPVVEAHRLILKENI